MKYLSTKYLNKIGRTALTMVLAGTYIFSSPLTLEAEETEQSKEYEAAEIMAGPAADETAADTTEDAVNTETSNAADEQSAEDDANHPSLVPGDLFYFVKIAFEKIQLAFTFDDAKEAKLLAEFSAERIAEAEALFKEGKDTEALETIKKALEYLEGSEEQLGEGAAEETDNNQQETAVEDTAVSEEGDAAGNDNTASAEEKEEEIGDNTDEGTAGEIKELISQNIIALTAAMEKVKNPKAKAALKKNIEKSFAKLERKAVKMAEKEERKANKAMKKAEKEEKDTVGEKQPAAENNLPAVDNKTETVKAPVRETERVSGAEQSKDTTVSETNEAAAPVTTTPPAASEPQIQDTQEPIHHAKAQEKAEIKQIKEQAKQEAKAVRHEAKQEAGAIRDAAKQEMKQKQAEMKQNHKTNQTDEKVNRGN